MSERGPASRVLEFVGGDRLLMKQVTIPLALSGAGQCIASLSCRSLRALQEAVERRQDSLLCTESECGTVGEDPLA